MATKTIEITTRILDENGKEEITVTSSKAIPDYDDFDKLGFREAFHQLEGAVLEAREEVTAQVTEKYLSNGSKKNSSKRKAGSPPKAVK